MHESDHVMDPHTCNMHHVILACLFLRSHYWTSCTNHTVKIHAGLKINQQQCLQPLHTAYQVHPSTARGRSGGGGWSALFEWPSMLSQLPPTTSIYNRIKAITHEKKKQECFLILSHFNIAKITVELRTSRKLMLIWRSISTSSIVPYSLCDVK